MTFDFNSFFTTPGTDLYVKRTPVKDEDIDDDEYVDGSQGQVKEIELTNESDVDKIGGKINFEKKVYIYKYEDPDNPSFSTSIEQKTYKEEGEA
ncbi:MAG: hypothetical protein ACOCT9_00580 [archaeon]